METYLTREDAEILLQLLTTLIIPFATSYIKKVTWTPLAKFGLAIALSLLAGFLTSFVGGNIRGSLIQNFAEIFTASQGIYYVFFKSLGLEEVFDPKTALADQIKKDVVDSTIAELSKEDVEKILNTSEIATQVIVETHVQGTSTVPQK